MATIQSKITNGHKYWYIVESRRVDGKPRPIVLEYLGKADDLLKRLQGDVENVKLKSYSHGLCAKMLDVASNLDLCEILNKYVDSKRSYTTQKPIRNGLTVGASLMLASLGRACTIVSKDAWSKWAKTTSLEYLLRTNFSKIDSQHFWDCMDAFPEENIEKAELEILRNVMLQYSIYTETLLYDTSNYYTYINTDNIHCDIAKRGKNKQKRNDLRQVGLALVVSKDGMIPLFHHSYEGNMNDSKVFKEIIEKIKERLGLLGISMREHTIVFDRGNNSKKNIKTITDLNMNFVGALSPYHHKKLMEEASDGLEEHLVGDKKMLVYKTARTIWGVDMTVVVTISDKLKEGQIRGIHTSITSFEKAVAKINKSLKNPRSKKRDEDKLNEIVKSLISRYKLNSIIDFHIEKNEDAFEIKTTVLEDKLTMLEEEMGYRIIMTNRQDWTAEQIIQTYHGQSYIENTFKNMKNRQHLSLNPQFHWTSQKIKIHNFCCVMGYLLSALIYRDAVEKGFKGSMDSLLDKLSGIRLGTIIENTGKSGRSKAIYKLEEMDSEENKLASDLNIVEIHKKAVKIKGLSVYI